MSIDFVVNMFEQHNNSPVNHTKMISSTKFYIYKLFGNIKMSIQYDDQFILNSDEITISDDHTSELLSIFSKNLKNACMIKYVKNYLRSAILKNDIDTVDIILTFASSHGMVHNVIANDSDIPNLFYLAIQLGFLPIVRLMYQKDHGVLNLVNPTKSGCEYVYRKSKGALHYAAKYNNICIVRFLIDVGCHQFELADEEFNIPISYAILNVNLEMIDLLARACPSSLLSKVTTFSNQTPTCRQYHFLDIAIIKNNIAMLQLLISLTQELLCSTCSIKDKLKMLFLGDQRMSDVLDRPSPHHGLTPLSMAASKGYTNIIEILVQCGSKAIDIPDVHQKYPIHYAIESGHVQLVPMLCRSTTIHQYCKFYGLSPFNTAMIYGHINIMEILRDFGAKVDIRNKDGDFARHRVSDHKYITSLDKLAQLGQDLNIKDKNGRTLLHYACAYGSTMLLQYLYERIDDGFNIADDYGSTPFHYAIFNSNCNGTSILECLIQLGLSISSINAPMGQSGKLPIVYAAEQGCRKVVSIFKAIDVEGEITNRIDYTALQPAAIRLLRKPITHKEMHKIRLRIYFKRSLVSRLIACVHYP